MEKVRRRWALLAGAVVVVLVAVVAAEHLLDADTYRGRIEAALSGELGRQVQLGHLGVSLFGGSLEAESLTIADDPAFSSQSFLTAKKIDVGVEMLPLVLHHELHVTGFTIDEPSIVLVRGADGTWNYSSLGGKRRKPAGNESQVTNLTVGKIEIKNGTVTIGSRPQVGKPRVYSDLNVSVEKFSQDSQFPFKVSGKLPGGGELEVSGTAGPVDEKDASLTPVNAQVSLKHADLVAAGLVEESQGIAGLAEMDAKVVSNGQTAQADGTLHLTQLKLAKDGTASGQPVDVAFQVNQDLRALAGKIGSVKAQVGKATVNVGGTYETQGNVTQVQLKADGQSMPVDDLVAFLPSLGVQLPSGSHLQGGTMSATLDVSGPVTGLVVTGPVKIVNTQLAGFDLGQKLASVNSLTGAKTGSTTAIQLLSTDLRYSPAGTQTNNLAAVVTGVGAVSGNGSISAGGALDYHVLVKLDSSGVMGMAAQQLGGLLRGSLGQALGQATKNGIPVAIGGTTQNPTFAPELGKVMSGAAQQKTASPSAPSSLGKALSGLLGR